MLKIRLYYYLELLKQLHSYLVPIQVFLEARISQSILRAHLLQT
jgi:hypothetical protein